MGYPRAVGDEPFSKNASIVGPNFKLQNGRREMRGESEAGQDPSFVQSLMYLPLIRFPVYGDVIMVLITVRDLIA